MQQAFTCNCETGFCSVRGRKIPESMRLQCSTGHKDIVDTFLQHIDNANAGRKAARNVSSTSRNKQKHVPVEPGKRLIGSTLLKAFEAALGRRIGCGECKRTLLNFSADDLVNVDDAEDRIYRVGLEIPDSICDRNSTAQRAWIRGVIEGVNLARTQLKPVPPPQVKYNKASTTRHQPLIGVPIDRAKLQSHIMYHIMPLSGDTEWVWRRHCNWLREVRHKFNGRLIVGIVSPGEQDAWEYCTAEAVHEALDGLDAEFITAPNDTGTRKRRKHVRHGRGEGVLFPQMLAKLQTSDPNQVAFYGHCKGVTRPQTHPDAAIHLWAEAMFETVFRNHDAAIDTLDTHGVCGSFKMPGGYRDGGPGIGSNWFFSGTFFATRLVDAFRGKWEYLPKHYGCVEQWPRLNFERDTQAACLFFDNVTNLYDEDYWKTVVTPAFEQWKLENGPR